MLVHRDKDKTLISTSPTLEPDCNQETGSTSWGSSQGMAQSFSLLVPFPVNSGQKAETLDSALLPARSAATPASASPQNTKEQRQTTQTWI